MFHIVFEKLLNMLYFVKLFEIFSQFLSFVVVGKVFRRFIWENFDKNDALKRYCQNWKQK